MTQAVLYKDYSIRSTPAYQSDICRWSIQPLRQQGLSQSEIMEVVAMSAFAVTANIIADATAMESDHMFDTL